MTEVILLKGGGGVYSSDLTAELKDVFTGLTAVCKDTDDEPGTGTMPDNTGYQYLLPINGTVTLPSGYYSGKGKEKVTQDIPVYNSTKAITPTALNLTINGGLYLETNVVIEGDPNLKAENIKAGVTIFGITGTYKMPLEKPTLTQNEYAILGTAKAVVTYKNYDPLTMEISGTTETTIPGSYNINFNIIDTYRYEWADHTTGTVTIPWKAVKYYLSSSYRGWSTLVFKGGVANDSYSYSVNGGASGTYGSDTPSGSGGGTRMYYEFDYNSIYCDCWQHVNHNSELNSTITVGYLNCTIYLKDEISAGTKIKITGEWEPHLDGHTDPGRTYPPVNIGGNGWGKSMQDLNALFNSTIIVPNKMNKIEIKCSLCRCRIRSILTAY